MTTALIAMHCPPLLILCFGTSLAWQINALLGIAVMLSMRWHLRQQRLAIAAVRLEATAAGQWQIYRANGRCDEVELLAQMNFGWCILLLMKQNGRRFRLLIKCGGQNREQLHRLRVLRVSEQGG